MFGLSALGLWDLHCREVVNARRRARLQDAEIAHETMKHAVLAAHGLAHPGDIEHVKLATLQSGGTWAVVWQGFGSVQVFDVTP